MLLCGSEVGRTLRGTARPLSEPTYISGLREVQQREDRQAEEGGEPDIRSYALDQIHF